MALFGIPMRDSPPAAKADIVEDLVPGAGDVGQVVRQSPEKTEICAVGESAVMDPVAAARVVVGIKAGGGILRGHTKSNDVTGNRLGKLRSFP